MTAGDMVVVGEAVGVAGLLAAAVEVALTEGAAGRPEAVGDAVLADELLAVGVPVAAAGVEVSVAALVLEGVGLAPATGDAAGEAGAPPSTLGALSMPLT